MHNLVRSLVTADVRLWHVRCLGGGPDVVFTDVYQYDSWVAKLLGIPVFAHMRGDFWTEFSQLQQLRFDQGKLISAVKAGWLKWLMNRSIGFAHTVLPICNWLAEQVKAHVLTKRIKVLYQPIQTNVWTTKDDDLKTELKHPAIVSVMDFRILPKVKGMIQFLDVARKMPDVNFYVAGSGARAMVLTANQGNQARPSK